MNLRMLTLFKMIYGKFIFLAIVIVAAGMFLSSLNAAEPAKPNVILIYADDLGYGDIGCYGATAIKTPALDRIAAEGLRFTDGHCAASTCTPSRYAMMTGEYAWRKKGTHILTGDAHAIIRPDRFTLASMFKNAGYMNGVVGKWHLGLGDEKIDWNSEIKPGPLEIGFDYSWLIPATGDRVPCVYVENHRVAGLDPNDPIKVDYQKKVGDWPTGRENPDQLKLKAAFGHDMTIVNGIGRIGWMTGGKRALWKDEDMADVLTEKVTSFIDQYKDKPFFLYFSLHDPHAPRVPHPRFVGKTELGPRGDVIVQIDWCVEQILAKLDQLKIADNTLIIFSSDNGPVLVDGYSDGAAARNGKHKPAGPWRGGKYGVNEGSTRVPFLLRWPARIKPGVSDALVSQVDFIASFAALTGQKLPDSAAPDSIDILPALLGESKVGRDHFIEQGGRDVTPIRVGSWKAFRSKMPQLFNLDDDPTESKNLAEQHPEKVAEMFQKLDAITKAGRSR